VRAVAGTVVAGLAVAGIATTGAGAQTDTDPGVTAKAVKLGYIFSETGVAGSTFENAGKACQARIDRENAKGGVNGRQIDMEIIDLEASVHTTRRSAGDFQNLSGGQPGSGHGNEPL